MLISAADLGYIWPDIIPVGRCFELVNGRVRLYDSGTTVKTKIWATSNRNWIPATSCRMLGIPVPDFKGRDLGTQIVKGYDPVNKTMPESPGAEWQPAPNVILVREKVELQLRNGSILQTDAPEQYHWSDYGHEYEVVRVKRLSVGECCATCNYFVHNMCRCNPPYNGKFPSVAPDMWCGQYKRGDKCTTS